jgi:hypothetical protein
MKVSFLLLRSLSQIPLFVQRWKLEFGSGKIKWVLSSCWLKLRRNVVPYTMKKKNGM